MSSLTSKEVLIIDDAADVRLLARKVLEGDGAIVFEAESVDQALSLAASKAPHLVLTDIEMPVKTGFDFLRERQAVPGLKDVPTLVLSGHNEKEAVVRAISLGARDYILKPFRATLLLQKVRKALMVASFQSRAFPEAERPSVEMAVAVDVLKVGEMGCQIEGAVKLAPEESVKVSGEFIERLGIGEIVMRTTQQPATYAAQGRYRAEINFAGIGDEQARKIRQKIGEWK